MTFDEKKELVRLLRMYQEEMLLADTANKMRTEAIDGNGSYIPFVQGVKAQYNHARLISQKLDFQISKQIKTGIWR